MPQELSRGLKGLVSTSNGDYELAQRKAEETGLSHHCFCINYFDYKYEDKSDKEKSCRWTMCNLLWDSKKLRWVWIRESRFRKCFMKWLSLEGHPPQAFNYYFMFGRLIDIYVMQHVITNYHEYTILIIHFYKKKSYNFPNHYSSL